MWHARDMGSKRRVRECRSGRQRKEKYDTDMRGMVINFCTTEGKNIELISLLNEYNYDLS